MSSWDSLDRGLCWKVLIKGSVCVRGRGRERGGGASVCWLAHKYKDMKDRVKDRIKERQREREIKKKKQRKETQ